MHRNFVIYLSLLSICLLAGLTTLLFGPSLKWVKAIDDFHFNLTVLNAPQPENTDQETKEAKAASYDGHSRTRYSHSLIEQEDIPAPVDIVNFNLNDTSVYTSVPPLASDIAIVIDELRQQGVKNFHYYIPFHSEQQESASKIIQQVLAAKDPTIENFMIPLRLTRTAHNHDPPQYLNRSSLPVSEISGSSKKIPIVDKIVFSPIDKVNFTNSNEIQSFSSIRFGFTKIESEKFDASKTPLLAIWKDRVLLNQLVISTMALHKASFADLTVTMGESISLGEGKPVIPIDKFGYTLLKPSQGIEKPDKFPASGILDTELNQLTQQLEEEKNDSDTTDTFQTNVILTSTDSPEYVMSLIQDPFEKITQLYQVQKFKKVHQFLRLPLWLEAIILVELTLICAFLYKCKQFDQHLIYALLAALLFPISMFLSSSVGYWLPISPLLMILCVGWFISTLMSNRWKLRRVSDSVDKEFKKELERFN